MVEIIKYTAKLTVELAQKGEQLSTISRKNGEDVTLKILTRIVSNLNASVNIGSKMNSEQVLETSVTILAEYWMFKIDEVLNCFKMAKGGRFGQIYGLDQPTVMGFLHKYDTEIKVGHYDEIVPVHTNRAREENQGTKHISLSVDEIKKLENKDKTPL